MNPKLNNQNGLNLPVPTTDIKLAPGRNFESKVPSFESNSMTNIPQAGTQSLNGTPNLGLNLPTIQSPQSVQNNVVSNTMDSAVPNTANDGDLIEKEWVKKAKQIIESTRNDPYQQSKLLTIYKADYMQKRYNKLIKLSE